MPALRAGPPAFRHRLLGRAGADAPGVLQVKYDREAGERVVEEKTTN